MGIISNINVYAVVVYRVVHKPMCSFCSVSVFVPLRANGRSTHPLNDREKLRLLTYYRARRTDDLCRATTNFRPAPWFRIYNPVVAIFIFLPTYTSVPRRPSTQFWFARIFYK